MCLNFSHNFTLRGHPFGDSTLYLKHQVLPHVNQLVTTIILSLDSTTRPFVQPPRSHQLNPLIFSAWSNMKSSVYKKAKSKMKHYTEYWMLRDTCKTFHTFLRQPSIHCHNKIYSAAMLMQHYFKIPRY